MSTKGRGQGAAQASLDNPILSVENLVTEFRTGGGWYPAVRDVSFTVQHNETLAIVGESGCGKSVTALSIMGLVPPGNGRISGGNIRFAERDLVALGEGEMRKIRGDRISMIFQEPMTSLNPVLTVGFQVAEALCYHRDMGRREASAAALDLLEQVKIPSARQRFADYPHQFSGGMRQRVMIAMALACRPELLIADEPTTALDVTIQAQVLALLAELKAAYGMAMIFITHNLGVVASIADRVAAMYAGEIVEIAPVNQLFVRPTHPYTELLLRSIPRVDRDTGDLSVIAGQVPALGAMPTGCRFAPRCPLRESVCTMRDPPLVPLADAPDHHVRCWLRAPPVGGGHD
jgi:peptide/nickel transport system ATP-binding protein